MELILDVCFERDRNTVRNVAVDLAVLFSRNHELRKRFGVVGISTCIVGRAAQNPVVA